MSGGEPRVRPTAYWLVAPFVCLLCQWRGLFAWFRADDFAWLNLAAQIHSAGAAFAHLFTPRAEGTIRPLSESGFFLAGLNLFGLDPLPFHLIVFAVQCANLTLVAAIGTRLTGSRAAGLCAALLWAVHSSAVEPLGWTCVFNQVLCAMFLLAAFYAGMKQRVGLEWLFFLVGFGALELNLVYPALAAVYAWFFDRTRLRRTLPMFAVSVAYFVAHYCAVRLPRTGEYAMHFTGRMLKTLATYWGWSAGPTQLWTPIALPAWVVACGVAVITAALVLFGLGRRKTALFCAAWYVITIAPVLPLRDHITEYYVFIPAIGACWLGGWALARGWSAGGRARAVTAALAALFLAMMLPRTLAAAAWNYRVSMRARTLVEGLAGAGKRHPGKTVLLDGVDAELFWNAIEDHPARLVGIENLYLTPGTERTIGLPPGTDLPDFLLSGEAAASGLQEGTVVVYDVRGPLLRNITSAYAARPQETVLPARVDAANPLDAHLLGPEWFALDGNHRWMPRRATLRMAGPSKAGERLYLSGYCPEGALQQGVMTATVRVDESTLAPAAVREQGFTVSYALPDSLVGKREVRIAIEVDRTTRPANDARDLGLAFGVFEIR